MGISWHPPVKVVDASEVNFAAGVAQTAISARDLYRLSFQAVWAGYTSVTVKIQGTLDATGVVWSDLAGFSMTTSGDIISAEVGPYHSIRVHVTGTLSGGADTLTVYLQMARLAR